MQTTSSNSLRRVLGLAFGIAVVVGGTIGQGILRTPGLVAQGVPYANVMLMLWIAGGVIALVDAMSTVELAASIPLVGGPYAFARRAFGPVTGLAVGVTDWLGNVASIAYLAVVFAEYLHRLGLLTTVPLGVIAAAMPVLMASIQWFGTRAAGTSQEIGSAVKSVVFMGLVAALLFSPRAAPVASDNVISPTLSILAVIVAIRAIYGTYSGWNAAVYFNEEVADPGQSVARATFSGIALITVIYTLVVFACLNVLSVPALAKSNLALADAAAEVFGPLADTVITVISLISLATVINTMLMIFPRVLYAIGRDAGGVLGLARVTENGTPWTALGVTVIVSALLASIGVYDILLLLSTSLIAAVSVLINLAVIRMRLREPGLERPWRMPLFPLPALFAMIVNAALLVAFVYEDPVTSFWGFAGLGALVVPIYLAIRFRERAAG
ncbi:MAG: APC family permease [Novosphingobium sp.]